MAVPQIPQLPDPFEVMLKASREMDGGLGAVAWAVLELLRRGGMSDAELVALRVQMNTCFTVPSDETCNLVLRVIERRLVDDRINLADSVHRWY